VQESMAISALKQKGRMRGPKSMSTAWRGAQRF
jgi:hypothetical protein